MHKRSKINIFASFKVGNNRQKKLIKIHDVILTQFNIINNPLFPHNGQLMASSAPNPNKNVRHLPTLPKLEPKIDHFLPAVLNNRIEPTIILDRL